MTDPKTTQTLIRRGFAFYLPRETYGDLGRRLAQFNQAGPHRQTLRRTIGYETIGSQVDLTATYSFLGLKHRTLLTADFMEDDMKSKQWQLSGDPLRNYMTRNLGYSDSDLNFWMRPNPYQRDRLVAIPDPAFDPLVFPMTDASTYNLYNTLFGSLLSHTTELWDGRLVLSGSARQDWVKIHREQPLNADPDIANARQTNRVSTYGTGINLHLIPSQLVAFTNFSKSFNPAPQVDPNSGQIHGFTTARGLDGGFKGAVWDQRIGYTLSLFRATQDNEVTDNPAWLAEIDPAKALLLPRYAGGARSKTKGVGLDLSARVTDRLSLGGSLSWTDARVADNKANPALIGTRLTGNSGFPVRSASANLGYRLPPLGPLKNLSWGATYVYQVGYLRTVTLTTASAFSDPLWVPSKNEMNTYLTWQQPILAKLSKLKVSYTLNVHNVFDRLETTNGGYYPNGREVLFTAKLQY